MSEEIDSFRNAFFKQLIEEEQAKEAALKLKQYNCFHRYEVNNNEKTCYKCNHTVANNIKSINTSTLNDTKNIKDTKTTKNTKECTIA